VSEPLIVRMWKEKEGLERWVCCVETSSISFSWPWPFFRRITTSKEYVRKSGMWVSVENPDVELPRDVFYMAEELCRVLEEADMVVTPLTLLNDTA